MGTLSLTPSHPWGGEGDRRWGYKNLDREIQGASRMVSMSRCQERVEMPLERVEKLHTSPLPYLTLYISALWLFLGSILHYNVVIVSKALS